MSNHKFKLGDKVKALSTPRTLRLGITGQKLTVSEVEPDDYTGSLPVRVSNEGGTYFWVHHEDIKLRGKEKKPLKIGDKVIVKVQPNDFMLPVGTEGIVTGIDKYAPEYEVEALGDDWFYTREQLKRVKKEKPAEAAAPKRDIKAELAAAWPWPEGTPVRLSDSGTYAYNADLTGLTLGSDGSHLPPVLAARGCAVCYVDVHDVVLATRYSTCSGNSSRIISDRSEEDRTGALTRTEGAEYSAIEHRGVHAGGTGRYLYGPGDFRDNGDGTGTVLTLEEIFLNNLKK